MRKHRSSTAVATPPAPTTLFDTSASKQPFTWGRVPSRDEALHIAGQSGAWAYIGAMECGPFYRYLLLVRYSERMNTMAARAVVLAGWVLEDRETGGR